LSQKNSQFRIIEVGDVEFEAEENREDLGLASFSSDDEFYVLQFVGSVKEAWIEQLEKLGVGFGDYVRYNAFIVTIGFHTIYQVTSIRGMDFIRFITAFVPEFKISSRLKGRKGVLPLEEFRTLEIVPESTPFDKQGNLTIILQNPAYMSAVSEAIEALEGTLIAAEEDFLRVAVHLSPDAIDKIAAHVGVKWIEPYVPPKFFLNRAAAITNTPVVWNNYHCDGTGQIVAVADTGLDVGVDDATLHADFRGRIVRIYDLGRNNDASDPDGHGTHVAGIVLGDGSRSGGQIRGIAHGARLVFQSVMDAGGGLGGLPANLNRLFRPPYNDGARVHNNSWGAPVNGMYDQSARNVDEFVWDNRDMVIVFAAGNEGVDADTDGIVDLDSLDSPGTAKNCITVGGCENNRREINHTWAEFSFTAAPISNDLWADNPNGMMAFSSRGSTNDGRVKPDLIAPGSSILATKSSVANDPQHWGVSPNPAYMYMGGTSMATPHVSGAAAIVRGSLLHLLTAEAERKKWRQKVADLSPTAALIKAVLIHGTRRITGQYASPRNDAEDHSPTSQGRIPNNSQGFGRLDVEQSLFPPAPTVLELFDGHRLSTGEQREYQFLIEDSAVALKATLVWTDFRGRRLVNNLDLIVSTPDEKEYHGNFTDEQQPGQNMDDTNNVEKVIIEHPVPGIYRINVLGDNVPRTAPGGRGQDFALVVTGALSATLKAALEPSEEYPENPGTLPAPQLCNRNPPIIPSKGRDPSLEAIAERI